MKTKKYKQGTKKYKIKNNKGIKKYQVGSKGTGYYTGTKDHTKPISVKRQKTRTEGMIEGMNEIVNLGTMMGAAIKPVVGAGQEANALSKAGGSAFSPNTVRKNSNRVKRKYKMK